MPYVPAVSVISPSRWQAAATAAVSAASGVLATGSLTSSTASIAPRPRTSPTASYLSASAASRGVMTDSMWRAAPHRSSARIVSMAASAAAQATGLPP